MVALISTYILLNMWTKLGIISVPRSSGLEGLRDVEGFGRYKTLQSPTYVELVNRVFKN